MNTKVAKCLLAGLAMMGVVHIAATFSPMISGKLAPLNGTAQQAFIYMSIMCGALLVICGSVAFMLSGKTREYNFLRKPYMLIIVTLLIDGILAASFMPHNPCAWIIFILSLPLFIINIKTIIEYTYNKK